MSVELVLLVATWALFGVGYVVRRSRLLRDPKAGRLGAVPELISGAHDEQEREVRREERRRALTRADEPSPDGTAYVDGDPASPAWAGLEGFERGLVDGLAHEIERLASVERQARKKISCAYVVRAAAKMGRTHWYDGDPITTWHIETQGGQVFIGSFARARCLVFDKVTGTACDEAQARAIRHALLVWRRRRAHAQRRLLEVFDVD